jgi:hypothetical protein
MSGKPYACQGKYLDVRRTRCISGNKPMDVIGRVSADIHPLCCAYMNHKQKLRKKVMY